MDEEYHVYTRIEDITEQDDKHLAGAKKEIRNDLTVIIPENPFPDIEVDAYPPLKFSWVIPKKLAAMAFPRNKENLNFLVNQGITHLVTLTAGKKPPVDDIARLRWSEVPVEDFTPPSLDQIKKFIDICKKSDKNGEVSLYSNNFIYFMFLKIILLKSIILKRRNLEVKKHRHASIHLRSRN